MRTYRNCYMLFPASFKLALMCCSCLHHLWPWVASCSFVMHHAWLCIMPCSCVVCLLCCVLLLDSSVSLRSWGFVRICWFDYFMDSFFFLAASQARWPSPWISLLSLLCYLLRSIAMPRFLSLTLQASPNCHEPLTFDTLPSKPLFGYVTAFAQPLL